MVGADIVVAYYDLDLKTFHAVDYYITASSQCDGKNGVCPDERLGGRNDVTLLSGERRDGITIVKYRRPLQTNEPINDRPIPGDGELSSIIAAIGPLNSRKEANAHDFRDRTLGQSHPLLTFTPPDPTYIYYSIRSTDPYSPTLPSLPGAVHPSTTYFWIKCKLKES